MPSLQPRGVLIQAGILVLSVGVGAGVAARIVGALGWRSDLGWYVAVLLTRCLAIPLSMGAWLLLAYAVRFALFGLFPELFWRVDPRDAVMAGVEFMVAAVVLIVLGIPVWCMASAIAERVWSGTYRSSL
jgi:hypothetical protein